MLPIYLMVFGCLALAPAYAQEPGPERRWSGNAEASILITSGNTETETIGLGGEILYRPGIWNYKARGNLLRNTTLGVLRAKTTTAELRASRDFTPRLTGFSQFSYLENRFAGFKIRFGLEAGAAYQYLTSEKHALWAELGAGYLTERRTDHTTLSFPVAKPGLGYRWTITDYSDITNTLTYTQNLEEGLDWRLSNVAAVSSAISRIVSLKVSYTILHLNRPVPGFKKTDTTTSVAVVTKF